MSGRTAEAVKAIKAIEPWPAAQPVTVDDQVDKSDDTASTKPLKSIRAA